MRVIAAMTEREYSRKSSCDTKRHEKATPCRNLSLFNRDIKRQRKRTFRRFVSQLQAMAIILKEAARRRVTRRPATERTKPQATPEESFADVAARKREKLRVLMEAPAKEREAALKANAAVAARYFATPEGENELAD